MRLSAPVTIALLFITPFFATPPFSTRAVADPSRHRELGDVDWERDFSRAQARAQETGLPLFALFQEVPGCQTCVGFGEQVLSHPLLVEAIETQFVAVAVFNNLGGDDRRVLERFEEPSYNNPVVRFLNSDERDLLPRKAGVWFPGAMGQRMVAALDAAGRPVPAYLRDVVEELSAKRGERATFAMHCFWSGEACLGEIDGVLTSVVGWFDGREVVELTFDASVVSYTELLHGAAHCSDAVYTHSDEQQRTARLVFGARASRANGRASVAKDSDQKRSLRKSAYANAELTPRQTLRVNSALAAGKSPTSLLSPRQIEKALGPQ
jgi:hypothetical protein